MKNIIIKNKVFNRAEIARLIGWSPTSFNQWLNGKRKIPKLQELALESLLKDIGFQIEKKTSEPFILVRQGGDENWLVERVENNQVVLIENVELEIIMRYQVSEYLASRIKPYIMMAEEIKIKI
jgi:transcriptional regulator with XRE-family HTH domain